MIYSVIKLKSAAWLLSIIIAFSSPCLAQKKPTVPDISTTIAEDISDFTWARVSFRIKPPTKEAILWFYAYQYYDNSLPLRIEVNGHAAAYNSEKGKGKFIWHKTNIPANYFSPGVNRIVFRTDSSATNSWAIGAEWAENPRGSAKSSNRGKSWYTANLGYNYSLVGNYAVRLTDGGGNALAVTLLEPEKGKRPVARAFSPKVDPFPAGKGQFEAFSFERSFSGKELFDCPRDTHIETDGNLPIFRLKRGELIKDEDGNAQFNIDRTAFERTDSLKVPWWLGEQVTDTVWIKKVLELKNPETDKAALMFFYEIQAHYPRKGGYWSVEGGSQSPLHVIINGTELPPIKPDIGYRNRTEDWRQVDFPPGLLKKGINTVVMHAEKGGDWRFAYENSVSPNRSARSMDGGKTWDYNRLGENRNENGEYLVRFLLDRCHEQGMVWSASIALWEKDGKGFLTPVKNLEVSVTLEGETPAGAMFRPQVRFGTTPVPGEDSWTDWGEPSYGKNLTMQVPGQDFRYMQWRAVLSTRSLKITPRLTGVRLIVKGERGTFPDGKYVTLSSLDNPPLRLGSLERKYDSYGNEILRELRERYHLDDVVKDGRTELEKLALLASWVHESRFSSAKEGEQHRSKNGIDSRTTHWAPNNALWALNMFSRGYGHLDRRFGSHCHDYNSAFVGCCEALGFVARPLIMTRAESALGGHSFPEVWSNEFNRWILVDAYVNAYYLRDDGVPANTMEIHEAQFDSTLFKRISTFQMDRISSPARKAAGDAYKPQVKECPRGYESFGIWLRSDLMNEPAPYPIWDGVHSFRWDGRLWYDDPRAQSFAEFSRYSNRADDLYFSVNQCFINPEYRGGDLVVIRLSHTMPNFRCYEVRFDRRGEWTEYRSDFPVKLHKGENVIEIRPVNLWGIKGAASTVTMSNKLPG
ncbi:MAG: transglutaminase-like domain-containing protein [Candidatus Latescibacter sp.]|nr:transglutaminase-like domain-containing protein [Candidatus Latescibacter sp.]